MKKFLLIMGLLALLVAAGIEFKSYMLEGKTEKDVPEATVETAEVDTISAENSNHLAFKGVPIDGTLSNYVLKMKRAGFTPVEISDESAVLTGDFAGFKNCLVTVSVLKTTNLVNSISVAFPGRESWSLLETDYTNLKTMLTEKYGRPSKCVEKFESGPLQPQSDMERFTMLQLNECKWFTTYTTPKGTIRLSLENRDRNRFVQLQYTDAVNDKVIHKEALNDL